MSCGSSIHHPPSCQRQQKYQKQRQKRRKKERSKEREKANQEKKQREKRANQERSKERESKSIDTCMYTNANPMFLGGLDLLEIHRYKNVMRKG
jgi:hypothetical protein